MLVRLVVLAALFGFLFGFDEGVIAGALHLIHHAFHISPTVEGVMTGAVPLGAIAGAVIAAVMSDALGRRKVLAACAILFAFGSLASALATGPLVLTLARILLGIAIGASAMAAPQFLAELAPPRTRGAVVSTFQLMITMGIFFAYLSDMLLEPLGQWRLMLAVGIIPALIAWAGIAHSPESPRWLVLRGRHDEAAEVLTRLQPVLAPTEVVATIAEIRDRAERRGPEPGWADALNPGLRPLVIFTVMAFILQQFSGINAVIYYAPRIFAEAGFEGATTQLAATVGLGAINVLMTLVAMWVVDRLGRRKLFLIGFAGCFASLAVIACSTLSESHHTGYVTAVCLILYMSCFAVSLGPLPWLFMAELFPLRFRSRGMAIASIANWSTNFVVVSLFPVMLAAIGISATFGLFAACCLLGFIYAWRSAPETKNVSLEKLEASLARQGRAQPA
jgi:SP family galactose:H+ symporter-like MFS transporter